MCSFFNNTTNDIIIQEVAEDPEYLTRVFTINGKTKDWEIVGTGYLRIREIENSFYMVVRKEEDNMLANIPIRDDVSDRICSNGLLIENEEGWDN